MSDDKNLGWALKNGDLDRVKELIESNVCLYKFYSNKLHIDKRFIIGFPSVKPY